MFMMNSAQKTYKLRNTIQGAVFFFMSDPVCTLMYSGFFDLCRRTDRDLSICLPSSSMRILRKGFMSGLFPQTCIRIIWSLT